MESLETRLKRLVVTQGPISISQFINLCLADQQQGYYHHAATFGAKGDFITAPEVSQMFGEMLGLWVLSVWQQIETGQKFVFCEMGCGRGTLMDDMVRTIKKLRPDFFGKAHIILVETSHKLRAVVAEKLKPHAIDIEFADNVEKLPKLPLILIGNELLDCLAIHQYILDESGWHERMVTLDDVGNLCFALSPYPVNSALLPPHASHAGIGTLIETSPAREGLVEVIGKHIVSYGGAALLIDYGALTGGFGDTLQAMSKHQYQNPLAMPGQHDLTSHVDFSTLIARAQSVGCTIAAMTQGTFLEMLGIKHRAAQLCIGRDKHFRQKTALELERLTSSQAMGDLFKVLCLHPPADRVMRAA